MTCPPELLLVVLEDLHDSLARSCLHAETLRALGVKFRLKRPPLHFTLVIELVLHSDPLLDLGPEHPELALRKGICSDPIVAIRDSTIARLIEIASIDGSGLICWLALRALDLGFARSLTRTTLSVQKWLKPEVPVPWPLVEVLEHA